MAACEATEIVGRSKSKEPSTAIEQKTVHGNDGERDPEDIQSDIENPVEATGGADGTEEQIQRESAEHQAAAQTLDCLQLGGEQCSGGEPHDARPG